LDADPELGKEGESEVEEGNDAASSLVREDGGKSESRVVVDGDMKVFPAGAASVIELAVPGDAVPWADNASEFLDVEVEEISRSGAFVAYDRRRRLERGQTVQTVAAKNAADGGLGELGLGGDLKAWQLTAAKSEDPSHPERVRGGRGRRRLGRAVRKAGEAFGLEASEPFVDRTFRKTESGRDGGDRLMTLENPMDHLGSTQRGESGLTMHVHAAVPVWWLV
jgi:hypothetical protein